MDPYQRLKQAIAETMQDAIVRFNGRCRPAVEHIANELRMAVEAIDVELPPVYDKNFGDDKVCECGHPYYRHFDSYDDMEPVGCKYCDCDVFREKK